MDTSLCNPITLILKIIYVSNNLTTLQFSMLLASTATKAKQVIS